MTPQCFLRTPWDSELSKGVLCDANCVRLPSKTQRPNYHLSFRRIFPRAGVTKCHKVNTANNVGRATMQTAQRSRNRFHPTHWKSLPNESHSCHNCLMREMGKEKHETSTETDMRNNNSSNAKRSHDFLPIGAC